MPFQKGHKPFPKKNRKSIQTEIPSSNQNPTPEDVVSNLTAGIVLPRIQATVGPRTSPSSAASKATAAPAAPFQSDSDMTQIFGLLVKALERISDGQEDSREAATFALEQARRAQRPGNMVAPLVSAFNPQGDREYPRPSLKCKMFLPWEAEPESLSYEEIELLNLLEDGEYRVRRNDGTNMTITVAIQKNLNTGSPERMLMNSETGFNQAKHRLVVPLPDLLRRMLAQRAHTKEAANHVLTMEQRTNMVATGELPISTAER